VTRRHHFGRLGRNINEAPTTIFIQLDAPINRAAIPAGRPFKPVGRG